MKKKVLLGMSGGVDSSVAALLLKQQGYDVTGATMRLCPNKYLSDESIKKISIDIEDAKKVSQKLKINHIVLDFTKSFNEKVVSYFVKEYCDGRTPNPCVMCNKYIKFGILYDYAISSGFDFVSTGHYANVIFDKLLNKWLLKKANSTKDQSYVLYNLKQNQLSHILFPLSNYEKIHIRKIAEQNGLLVAQKKDSQDICFIKNNNYIDFIKNFSDYNLNLGNFVDIFGNILGTHQGILNYTIGQRKNLGIAFGKPMYVIGINVKNNTVVLGKNEQLYSNELVAKDVNFVLFDELKSKINVTARIRYKSNLSKATVEPLGNNKVKVIFEEKQQAITPGQSIVFYDNDIVLGGGIII